MLLYSFFEVLKLVQKNLRKIYTEIRISVGPLRNNESYIYYYRKNSSHYS